jgi:hypothetical protein
VFLGSGLLAGLAPRVGDRADNDRPLRLVMGAILVATASLAAPLLVILAIFATAGAGN